MSLAMRASKYNGGGGGARGDMRGFSFGPPAGTTTYGGSGVTRFAPVPGGPGTMTIGPGGVIQGDPGLFSFLGKAARGVTGLVSKLGIPFVSGAAGVAAGLLGGGRGPGMAGVQRIDPIMLQSRFQGTPAGAPIQTGLGGRQRFFPGGATGMGEGCGQGYRPNKSGYYVQGGQYVEPGSTCVKRRRMNPLNPRALSKAMRRIESAKRATTVLGRITIRKKC